jgi:hypothetical protein
MENVPRAVGGPKLERAKSRAVSRFPCHASTRKIHIMRWVTILCALFVLRSDAAEMPSVDDLLRYLHIQTSQRADLLKGKILTTDIGEEMDKELAVGCPPSAKVGHG